MLGFLHTAGSHVATFARLMREIAPDVGDRHLVAEDLLVAAAAAGAVDATLAARVASAVDELRAAGARVVVCTCSTIGDAAEAAGQPAAPVLRIDRPMAEEAVRRGSRIAVVAALPTALAATCQLLAAVAGERGRAVAIRPAACPQAWPLFARGDLAGYLAATAAAVRAAAPDADVVVLGQVSMAAVRDQLGDVATPVLAAAALGVRAAAARCRALSREVPPGACAPAPPAGGARR